MQKRLTTALLGLATIASTAMPATGAFAQQYTDTSFDNDQLLTSGSSALDRQFRNVILEFYRQFRNDRTSVPGRNIPTGLVPYLVIRYSNLGDPAFVRQLYRILLDRQPSQSEVNDWVNRLRDGETRRNVVLAFLNSDEFRNRDNGTVSDRVRDRLITLLVNAYSGQSNETFVRRLYTLLLNRTPSTGEVNDWVNRLNAGTSRREVILGFLNSSEFGNRTVDEEDILIELLLDETTGLGGSAFVRRLYSFLLNRTPSNSEVDYWVGRLNAGTSRRSIIQSFLDSTEFQNL